MTYTCPLSNWHIFHLDPLEKKKSSRSSTIENDGRNEEGTQVHGTSRPLIIIPTEGLLCNYPIIHVHFYFPIEVSRTLSACFSIKPNTSFLSSLYLSLSPQWV
eukprot:TRINITY_DN12158_c0_g1_i1.p1 TRINITY_DN12158_c0_g1~~TRINITY_DN12158_c0_g1_i1.p1  ORF type:complete len:103 (-),score=2.12 TRINITY_DN12158_c0_g1_i1:55-363(-)